MPDSESSIESSSDAAAATSLDRKNYPGKFQHFFLDLECRNRMANGCSKMVSLDLLQHDRSRLLQPQRTRYMGRDEQLGSRRFAVATASQRRQLTHFLPYGRELLLQ